MQKEDMNRKWMKEIKEIFENNVLNNSYLSTSEIQKYMKEKGAGPNQTSGAINTALEIGLLKKISYGKYELENSNIKKSNDIYEIVNRILNSAKKEINLMAKPEILDQDSFAYVKKTLDSLDKLIDLNI